MRVPFMLCRKSLGHVLSRCRNLGVRPAGSHTVSTLSPLGSAFNTLPPKKIRKFTQPNVGLFSIQDLTDYTKFEVLENKLESQIERIIQEICSRNRKRKMVVIFDELSDCICRVADMTEFIRMSHPQHHYREAAEKICLKMGQIVETLNTDVDIHRALQQVIQNGDVVELTDVDKRVGELFMFDFEQSGIHLEEDMRYQFVRINESIMRIGNDFVYHSLLPTPYLTDAAIKPYQDKFATEGERMFLKSLNTDHQSEKIREASYRVFLYPLKEQLSRLDDLLLGRRLLSQLVGFPTWAHRALRGTTVETPESVMNFLTTVSDKIKDGANEDYAAMKHIKDRIKQTQPNLVSNNEVMPWDPIFCTKYARAQMCNHEEVMEYFSLGNCMEGLNQLFKALYDVSLENVSPSNGEVWHSDVYKLAIVHSTEGTIGYIYCDFYERSGKPYQDCHHTIQGGRMKDNGEYQIPIVVLHLNFHKPSTFVPTLLWPGQVENLFHEFGHAMHSMLGRTQYQHVTGTRCPIDFAEVPSVLMEYFASDPRVLKTIARHYKTGKPLDPTALKNFCHSKRLFLHSEMQLQLFYAILDQVYHGEDFSPKSTMDVLKDVQNKYYGLPYVENTAWQLRFGHLVGYGGRYYAYLMARAIGSKIWRELFKQDPYSRESGEKYRNALLAHGGERHPMELLKDLFGEEQTVDMMIDSLIEDVETRAIRQS